LASQIIKTEGGQNSRRPELVAFDGKGGQQTAEHLYIEVNLNFAGKEGRKEGKWQ
jgi:hypothetical protein